MENLITAGDRPSHSHMNLGRQSTQTSQRNSVEETLLEHSIQSQRLIMFPKASRAPHTAYFRNYGITRLILQTIHTMYITLSDLLPTLSSVLFLVG